MLGEMLVKVGEKWHRECLKLAKPLSEQAVIENFANHGILLARDAIEVYSNIGGFDEDNMDAECLTFWTVDKILRENELNAEEVYFADF